jgi:hypothetical protein
VGTALISFSFQFKPVLYLFVSLHLFPIERLPDIIQNFNLSLILIGVGLLILSYITNKTSLFTDTLLLGTFTLICVSFYSLVEQMVGFHDHQAWDGTQYYAVYHFFCDGTYGSVTGLANVHPFFPYNQRILIPLLASLVSPTDSIWGFRLVNSMFLVLSVMACYVLWVKYCHLSKAISLLGIFFLFVSLDGANKRNERMRVHGGPPRLFF